MKNKILLILSILLMFTACSNKKTEQTQSLYSYIDEKDGTTLMSEIAAGEKLPSYIHYFVANSVDGTIVEEDMIRIVCEELAKLDIIVSDPKGDLSIEDGTIYFSMFFPDGDHVNLYFETTAYFVSDGTYFPVKEVSILQRLMKDIPDHLVYDTDSEDYDTDNVTFLNYSDGKFSWDGDGNGEEEVYILEYLDDEKSDPQIKIYPEADPDTSGIISNAYEIKAIESRRDSKGNYLLIRYTTGDRENHNNLSSIVYRFDDGEPGVK
ncbi:MAG: hypothetical protein IJL85_04275 [Erysipelotrichaceae bacterium]|nr:hypothetical protein [Erysipelotrichaceae bacterium]